MTSTPKVRANKFYVYCYIDPRNDEPIYIGKGHGDRDQQHLHECYEKRNTTRPFHIYLRQMLDQEVTPNISRIAIDLAETEAFFFEGFFIDALGIQGSRKNPGTLLNGFRGGSGGYSRMGIHTKQPGRKYKGVGIRRPRDPNKTPYFMVTIKLDGRTRGFGPYGDDETAARVYDEIIMEKRGKGYLNFRDEWNGTQCLRPPLWLPKSKPPLRLPKKATN